MKAPVSGTCVVCGKRYRKGADTRIMRPGYRVSVRGQEDSPLLRLAHKGRCADSAPWRRKETA